MNVIHLLGPDVSNHLLQSGLPYSPLIVPFALCLLVLVYTLPEHRGVVCLIPKV